MLVDVLRPSYDCTNNGVSKFRNEFILINENDVDNYASEETSGYLVLVEDVCLGDPRQRAIPFGSYMNEDWTMFGGNFVYSSDSRFPSNSPIKIFDRIEA